MYALMTHGHAADREYMCNFRLLKCHVILGLLVGRIYLWQLQTAPELSATVEDVAVAVRVTSWEKGMRLEALDRLNPSLVCVATVGKLSSQYQCSMFHVFDPM